MYNTETVRSRINGDIKELAEGWGSIVMYDFKQKRDRKLPEFLQIIAILDPKAQDMLDGKKYL